MPNTNKSNWTALRLILALVFIFSTIQSTGASQPEPTSRMAEPASQPEPGAQAFAPDRLIVKLDPLVAQAFTPQDGDNLSSQALANLAPGVPVRSSRQLFKADRTTQSDSAMLEGIFLLELAPGSDVLQAVESFAGNAAVEWAEPDYLAYPVVTPNDPLFNLQWGLTQIDAPAAWDLSTGSATVTIAMIDSGVQFSHPDLAGKLWTNPGETPANGLDDDNNGYIDDLHGWDFVNSDNTPADDNGHGTQTAGVAGAASNNGIGVAGVCWDCTLMPVKVMQAGGVANYSDIAAGVLYAARKGARVINISLGGYSESSALLAAIQSANETYGALIVAGAGNDALETPFFPAAYPQVLAVAATAPGDLRWSGSNYGEWVDIAAPGEAITTTFQGGDYGSVDGTSLSTAFVSGLAGLLRSQNPDWTAEMVRAQIIHTAENIDSLNPGYAGKLGAGRIAAGAALSTTPHPLLSFAGQTVDGNPNGRPEPGSSVAMVVSLYNDWATAASVQATLSSASPYVTMTTASAAYGEIPAYATVPNPAPFGFTVSASAPFGAEISLNLRVTASGGYVVNIPVTVQTASATVEVPATIYTQTWTNDRIYLINKATGIPAGNTLTIEPGTLIQFTGDFNLSVQGALVADGSSEEPILLFGNNSGLINNTGQINFTDTSADAIFDAAGNYLSGSVIRYAHLKNIQGILIESSSPYTANNHFIEFGGVWGKITEGLRLNDNKFTCSSESPAMVELESSRNFQITGNKINGCSEGIHVDGSGIISNNQISNASGGGIFAGSVDTDPYLTITENSVTDSRIGIFSYPSGNTTSIIQNNLIAQNSFVGLLARYGYPSIRNNTILANSETGIKIDAGSAVPLIYNNNLLPGDSGIVLRNLISVDVTAQQNWWGTTNPIEIDAAIYDSKDEFGLGTVSYTPYLSAPEPDAPAYVTDVEISPDTTLGIQTATFDVKFNREMDQTYVPDMIFQSSRQETWTTFTPSNSELPEEEIDTISVAPDGAVWIAYVSHDLFERKGVLRFDGETWIIYNASNSGLPDGRVFAISFAADGSVWFGGEDFGLVRFDGVSWTIYNISNSGLPGNSIYDIAISPDGAIWICTDHGAARFDGANWATYNLSNSGLPGTPYGLSIALDSAVWFSTHEGSARFDGINWDIYTTTNSGLPSDYILDMTVAPDGSIWFSTLEGAACFDGADWIVYTTSTSELPADYIFSIAVADDGSTWFGTFNGAVRFDGTDWVIYVPSNSGLPSITATTITSSPDGPVWFGTAYGFAAFWKFPTNSPDSDYWLDSTTYRATLDITSLIPRDNYLVNISGAVGTDGIEIVPVTGYPFTVDYAGAISDTTPPPAPTVNLCAGDSLGELNATWSVIDPETAIDIYSYAIGTSPGGSEVVDWTSTTATSFSRTNLNLTAGQTYYVAVKARNAGGLWSVAGIPPGVVAGSGVCTTNIRSVYLPMVKSRP